MPDAEPLLVTTREAAKRLGVSDKTFRQLVMAGRIPFVSIGAQRRFVVADLLDFVERGRTFVPQIPRRSTKPRDSNGWSGETFTEVRERLRRERQQAREADELTKRLRLAEPIRRKPGRRAND
jgi:excisionase family DNA binding protein